VVKGGFLFDQEGNESDQLDLIVTGDTSMRFELLAQDGHGKTFACIDGCLAVVSIKSKLTKDTLFDALQNLATIPEKLPWSSVGSPQVHLPLYDELPYKVIYASDSLKYETIKMHLEDFYNTHPDIPSRKRPNLIHVAGKYVIMRIDEEGQHDPDGVLLPKHTYWGSQTQPDLLGLVARRHRRTGTS
jgi:hypothetical protein